LVFPGAVLVGKALDAPASNGVTIRSVGLNRVGAVVVGLASDGNAPIGLAAPVASASVRQFLVRAGIPAAAALAGIIGRQARIA
jgi:hypothetical protein